MSIETINLNEFINLIHPIDKYEKSNTDHKETEINIKISAFKERLLQTKNKNIYEEQAITTKIIKEALPKIEEKNNLHIVLWTRIAIFISIAHGINTKAMLNKYLEWRKNEGKDYFRISKVNSKNYTTIDQFILKGINERNFKDFYCNWVLIKPALSSIPENCKTKTDIVKKYGRLNVAKVNVAINNAYEDKLIEKLILNLNKNMIEDKKYRYLGNINSFYYELCKKSNLEVTLSIFTGIVSHFVEIKYRGE